MKIFIGIRPRPWLDIKREDDWVLSSVSGSVHDPSAYQAANDTISKAKRDSFSFCFNVLPEDAKLLFGEIGENTPVPEMLIQLYKKIPPSETQDDRSGEQEPYAEIRLILVNEAMYAEDRKKGCRGKNCNGADNEKNGVCKKSTFSRLKDFCKHILRGRNHVNPNVKWTEEFKCMQESVLHKLLCHDATA